MAPINDNVVMEGVQLIFRNFAGKERQFNQPGSQNFCVLLDEETADEMGKDGWGVKILKPREDDEEDNEFRAILPVKIKYGKGRPPRIWLITSRGRSSLDQEDLKMLDWADITNVDLIIRPYPWDINGKSGITAYLQSLFVTINEDPLEAKYAEMDSSDDHH
jgi:hypothetical protein